MKIEFTVTKLFTMENGETKEQFTKLQLVKTVTKEINGSKTTARLVAYHNVQSTTLVEGSKFIFDDVNYEMVKQQFIDESTGLTKEQKVIYLKAE